MEKLLAKIVPYGDPVHQLFTVVLVSTDRPDNALPGGPTYPSHGLPQPPVDPGYGRPGGGWSPVDPGYGGGRPGGVDPGYGHGGGFRPDNSLPVAPVRPGTPIVLPPGIWPPQLPPGPAIDNTLPTPPPGTATPPIHIPPDPDLGIEQPIYLPPLPAGTALLIALPPHAQPKGGTPAPAGAKPAILVQSGKKPVLVYVTGAPAQPK
jgi:hypothetical protein